LKLDFVLWRLGEGQKGNAESTNLGSKAVNKDGLNKDL